MDTATRHALNAKRLKLAHPTLRQKVEAVIADLEKQGWQPLVDGDIWRSPAKQLEKFNLGYSKTKFGFHCTVHFEGDKELPCALAADIVDCRYLWDIPQDHTFWGALGRTAKKTGMIWGGDWQMKDVAHIQILKNSDLSKVKAYYDSRGKYGLMPAIETPKPTRKSIVVKVGAAKLAGELDATKGIAYVIEGPDNHRTPIRERFRGASFEWDKEKTVVTVHLPD